MNATELKSHMQAVDLTMDTNMVRDLNYIDVDIVALEIVPTLQK